MAKKVKLPCVHQLQQLDDVKVACRTRKGQGHFHQAFACALYGKCIPSFKGPWGKNQKPYEGKWYRLCHDKKGVCPDYETRNSSV